MRYFLNILLLMSFVAPVFGSEKDEKVCFLQNYNEEVVYPIDLLCLKETHFYAKPTLMYSLLCYSDKKYIDFLNQTYGMVCETNEPFIRVKYSATHKDHQSLKEKFIDPINKIPFKYFLVGETIQKKGNVFKLKHHALLSFSIQDEGKPVRIRLNEAFVVPGSRAVGDEALKELLERFKKMPLVQWDSYDKHEKLKKELLDAGILMEIEGDLTHGPNGYFGKEVKEEHQKRLNKDFWWIMIPIATMYIALIAVPIIAAYALYKKHHVTAV